MNLKKLLLIAGSVAGLGLATITGAALAQDTDTTDPWSNLVDKIAQRFNLNRDDVQQVFDEQKTEMEAQREPTCLAPKKNPTVTASASQLPSGLSSSITAQSPL